MPKISNEDYETNKVQQSDFGKPVSKDAADVSSTSMFGEGFHRILQQAQQPIPQLGGWNAEQAAAPAALATGVAGYGLKKLYNAVTGKPDEPPSYEQLHPEDERSRRLKNDIMEYDFNAKKQADLQKAQATQPTAPQPTEPVNPVEQPVAQASTPTNNNVSPPATAPQNSVPPEIQQLQQKSADIAAAQQQDVPNVVSTKPETNTQDLNPAIEEAINKPAEVVKTTTDPKPNIQNISDTEKPKLTGRAATNALNEEYAIANANAPAGYRAVDPTRNRLPGEKIGVGGWTHVSNTYGPQRAEELWNQSIGPKNVPYNEAVNRLQNFNNGEMMGGEPGRFNETPLPTSNSGRPKLAPSYVRGSIPNPSDLGVGPLGLSAMLSMYSKDADAHTLTGEAQKYNGGRGAVNPPNVDPNTQTPISAIGDFFQKLMGDKTPYSHIGLEDKRPKTPKAQQYK